MEKNLLQQIVNKTVNTIGHTQFLLQTKPDQTRKAAPL